MALHRIGDTGVAGRVNARLERRGRDLGGDVFRLALQIALGLSLVILAVLVVDVVVDGRDVLSTRLGSFLSGTLRTAPSEAGVFQGLRGTFWIAVFVILLSFPIGIGAAIYLEEYAKPGRLKRFVEINIRNLAGVPSVVYGLLGLSIFVTTLHSITGGSTVMAGGLTLAVLVLPIVIITASEALRAVPDSLREAGYGIGATKWEVTRSFVLPYAAPGILTGTLLSLSRALGEAAPLIVVGAVTGRLGGRYGMFDVDQLRESFTAMPIVITAWVKKPGADFKALSAAAIVVLLVVILLLNSVAILLRNRFEKKRS
jgi:phosphate transport system permease protein